MEMEILIMFFVWWVDYLSLFWGFLDGKIIFRLKIFVKKLEIIYHFQKFQIKSVTEGIFTHAGGGGVN